METYIAAMTAAYTTMWGIKAMTYSPEYLKLASKPADYAGADWTGWYAVLSQHRDSDALARSNFTAALDLLQTVEGHDNPAPMPPGTFDRHESYEVVYVGSASHWAVGWCESIYVHKDAPEAVLRAADDILRRMADYPVLDESAYCELEWTEAANWWRDMGLQGRIDLCRECGISIFAARHKDSIPQDDMDGRLYERLRGS